MILTNFLLKDLFRECSLKFTFYVIESLQSQGHKRRRYISGAANHPPGRRRRDRNR